MACLPVDGMGVEEKAALSRKLMHAGADIHELNVIRRAYSQFKGGGMLGHARGPVHSFVLSDVPGDDPAIIGSGPTWPEGPNEGSKSPLQILKKFHIDAPRVAPAKKVICSWPHSYKIVATPKNLLSRVEHCLEDHGWDVTNLGDREEGCPNEMAARHLDLFMRPTSANMAIISGGEASAKVTGNGVGGPNREFVLEVMLEARRRALTGSLTVLSVDTDGVDGGNDVAGGILCMSECRSEAWAQQASLALKSSDSGGFLDHFDASIRTGPTGTNLNDLRILLWRP
jgi:Putative glycerate kinase